MNTSATAWNSDSDLSNLGNVLCVSELAIRNREEMVSAPVLVSENALVFLAWQDERSN